MLQLERVNDSEESLRVALKGHQTNLWTALPGTVQSYNAAQGTCTVQPTIQALATNDLGVQSWVDLPLLVDVPVIYMGGGAFVATFPITAGDEALVIFSSRCIDGWWQNGGVQPQAELRMHDLSDGFALIGPRSLANSISDVSTSTAQLRSLDGSTYFEIAPGQVANVKAPGGVNITGPVSITGNLTVTGTVNATQEGTFNGIPMSTHLHTGVAAGPSNTGEPIG
jgi:Phage protein Gp138 N-terminal domain